MSKGLVAALALAASGCAVDPTSRYRPTESQLYVQDFFGPRDVTTVAPVYCYSTLADPECYGAPVIGWEQRLVAYFGPRPF